MKAAVYKYWLFIFLSVGFYSKAHAQLSIGAANINSCTGSISISVTGGNSSYTYVWSYSIPSDGVTFTELSGLTSNNISGQIPGHYKVVVTDANNDTVTATYEISDSTTITANIEFSGLICPEDPSSGAIILTFNNGTPPFTWQLLDNNNGLQLVNFGGGLLTNYILINQDTSGNRLVVGDYRFEWSGANGCSGVIENILITEPAPTNLTINTETGVTCFGDTDGVVNLSVTGGYGANYSVAIVADGNAAPTLGEYINIGGGGSYTVSNLPAGDYRAYYYDRLSLPPYTTPYGLDVTDNSICQKFEDFTITSPEALSTTIAGELLSCFGDADGNITGTISGGTAPYTITLDTNSTQIVVNTDGDSFDFSGLTAGDYTFTITDANNCSTTANSSITQPLAALTANLDSFSNILCFGGNTGNITIAVAGGTPNYIFELNTVSNTPQNNGNGTWTFSNLSAGNHIISIKDSSGCTVADINRSLSEPNAIAVTTNGEALVCSGDDNGNITGTISGGVAPYTITLIQNNTPIIVTLNGGAYDFFNLTAGTYNLTVVDSSGCSTTAQESITEPDPIQVNTSGSALLCFGDTNGTITGTITDGTAPYTITLDATSEVVNVATSGGVFNFNNLSAGDYSFTVVDNLGCTINPEATITQPDELIPTFISKQDALCNGASDGSITIRVTGGTSPYIFTVNGSPANATQNGNEYTFENLSANNYTITVTDQNNCASNPIQIQQEITEPDLLTISLTAFQDLSCFNANDGFITVGVNGGTPNYIFSLTGPSTPSPVDNGNGTFTFSNLSAGNYTVTVTDPNNCASTPTQIQQTLSQPVQLDVDITKQDISCNGLQDGSITVTNYNLAYTYALFNITAPLSQITGNNGVYQNLPAGNYKLEASVPGNNSAICLFPTEFTINEPTLITLASSQVSTFNAGTGSDMNISCNGGNDGGISISPTGGTGSYSYAWSTIDGSITNGTETNKDITGLTAGTYTVEVKDQNNCPQSFEFTLAEPRVLSNTALITENNTCFSGLTGSITSQILNSGSVDGITYIYTIIGTPALPVSYPSTQTTTALSATFNSLPAGSFRVEIVDQNGCSTASSPDVTLTEPSDPITIDTTISNFNGFQIECFGDNNGAITINSISGGTPFGGPSFYTISWTGPNAFTSTSTSLTNLAPGTYTLNVEDANSCVHTEEYTIEAPQDVLITTDSTSNTICSGASNGGILITPTGGTGNYTFSWTKNGAPFATTEDLTNIGAGNYEVTLTDNNGCFTTAAYTITELPVLNLTIDTIANVLCFGDNTGSIAISVSGGTGAYRYAWTKDGVAYDITEDLSTLTAGVYEVTVTDAAGCSIIEPITVTQTDEIAVNYTKTDITCSGDNNGTIDLNLSGGMAPYNISWSDFGTGLTRTNLAAGSYTITVTDALLCTVSETIEITTESTLNLNTTVTHISCFGANDGSIELNISGEQAPLTVTWQDDASAGVDRYNLTPGTYSATILDGTGCSVNQSFTINEPASIVLDAIITNAIDCDNLNSGAIDLQVTGGTAPFTFDWSHGATNEDLISLGANNYTITVTDSKGCQQQATYTVTRQAPLKLEVVTTADPNCNDKMVIQRNELVITGGVAPYNIDWSSGVVSGVNGEIMETGQNGTIIIEVTDAVGCLKELIFDIDLLEIGAPVFDYTSLSFTSFNTLSINDPITFTSTSTGDAVSYLWDFGDGSNSTAQNPIHDFKVVGSYLVTLTVTYPYGCSYSYQQLLTLGLGYNLVVPTAFTPNGDGINDTLRPVFTGMSIVHMSVYDTWGTIVYKESGATINGWDGTINGASAENGNYSIVVQATTFNGVIINTNKPIVLIN